MKRIKSFAKRLLRNIILDPKEINRNKKYVRENSTRSVPNE